MHVSHELNRKRRSIRSGMGLGDSARVTGGRTAINGHRPSVNG
jgi:hypothetical protein